MAIWKNLSSHDFIDYFITITSTSAASMLPIKLSNKCFSKDNAMKYQFHSVLRDKLTATNNYTIKIIIMKKKIIPILFIYQSVKHSESKIDKKLKSNYEND